MKKKLFYLLSTITLPFVLLNNDNFKENHAENNKYSGFISKKASDTKKITSKDIYNNKIVALEKKYSDTRKLYKNVDYNSAKNNINLAKKQAQALRSNNSKENLKSFNQTINKANLNLLYSRAVESRAIYLDADSIPTTKKEISDLIIKIKKANFNIIYPEVVRRGYSIYPNKITDIEDKFKKCDFDVFKYIVDESHRNNIEVYPWVWVFRVKSPLWGDSFLNKYPDLIAKKGKYSFEDREPLFLSPSEPKARELMLSLISDIAKNYQIDGILLDYIRFDETLPDDILTKKYFRDYYFQKYKREPANKIVLGDNDFLEFQLWRENQVTEMVKNIKTEIKINRPKAKVGVAVFRNESQTRLLKMQDWRYWYNKNYIDFICPMLYTDLPKELDNWIDTESDYNERKDFIYPSLGALRFNKNSDLYPLADLLHKRNVLGFNIFSLVHFGTESFDELSEGIFRKKSFITDHSLEKSLDIILEENNNWLKKISNEERNNSSEINKAIVKINKLANTTNKKDFEKISLEIKKLSLPKNLINEITSQLEYAIQIIEVYDFKKDSVGKIFRQTPPPSLKVLEEAKYIPPAKFFKTTKKAIIDGNLEDDFWDRIEPISNFYSYDGTISTQVETITKLAYNKENIYISFENIEPEMNNSKKDSIEIYINDKKRQHHFLVDINNKKDYEVNKNKKSPSVFTSSIKKLTDKWFVEVQIPIKHLGLSDLNNISANFVRNRDIEIIKKNVWFPNYNQKDKTIIFGKTIFIK
ncbi:MAG: family 10 glycosylhydrolase [Cyanobacteriota bacterium]